MGINSIRTPLILALTTLSSLAQTNYEPYIFTTLAGGGGFSTNQPGSAARLWWPIAVAVDAEGNVYVADQVNHAIRKVTPHGLLTTLAGRPGTSGNANGTGTTARFNLPSAAAVDRDGNVYVADTLNHSIRKVTSDGMVTTLAGLGGSFGSADGTRTAARFRGPTGVAIGDSGMLFVADQLNHTIRSVTSGRGLASTLAGLPGYGGISDRTNDQARFGGPSGVAVDSAGNLYVTETVTCTIRKVTSSGVATTLAGRPGVAGGDDGMNRDASFQYPQGIAMEKSGRLYVADTSGSTIRKVTPEGDDWVVTTLAGRYDTPGYQNGTGSGVLFNNPSGVAVDSAGNVLVADTLNHVIRKVTPAGVVTTVAGQPGAPGDADGPGTAASFYAPMGVAVDSVDNLYVADTYNNTIRKVTPTRVVTTLGGLAGNLGTADGTGDAVRFANPFAVAVDLSGNLYVSDFYFGTIRKGVPTPRILNQRIYGDQFGFDLEGPTGRLVVVEASDDLVNWLPVWNNVFDVGSLSFRDSWGAQLHHRFYRASFP